jgi:hypothetical protein
MVLVNNVLGEQGDTAYQYLALVRVVSLRDPPDIDVIAEMHPAPITISDILLVGGCHRSAELCPTITATKRYPRSPQRITNLHRKWATAKTLQTLSTSKRDRSA